MKNLIYLFVFACLVSACTPNNTAMNDKGAKNEARVQQFYDQVLNAHNVAMVDSFCHPDFVDHQPFPGHSGKGLDDLKAQMTEFFTLYPDVHFKTDFMISKGDTVVTKVVLTGTNTGAMGPNMPATNKTINVEATDIIVIKDGKATDRWGYTEEMKMMSQLGLMTSHDMAEASKEGEKKEEKK